MKPSTSGATSQHQHLNGAMFRDGTQFDETEFELAEILLQLPQLVFQSESFHWLSWGRMRRRSSPVGSNFIPEIEKPRAPSPATPLLFPHNEYDDKSKQSRRKVSVKRRKIFLLEKIEELTKCKEVLKEEIKHVQCYYNKQKLLNLSLKAKKQMLILELPKEDSSSQPNLHHAAMLNIPDEKQQSCYLVHHPPLIMDDTAENVSSLDKSEKKVLAAQARYRRMQIRRFNKHNVKRVEK